MFKHPASKFRKLGKPVKIQARKRWDNAEYGSSWETLSRKCKQRDNWTCRRCGWHSTDHTGLDADHITPLTKGGKNTLSNLQTLCVTCHGKKHGRKLRR